MSGTDSGIDESLIEDNVQIAIGDLLIEDWDKSNTAGYYPVNDVVSPDDEQAIRIHTGWENEDLGYPQIALTDVSSRATGDGYTAWKATGEGMVMRYIGRIDANTFVGSVNDVEQPPSLLANAIGGEVRRVAHENSTGVDDPASDTRLTHMLSPLTRPQNRVTSQAPQSTHSSIVELQYRTIEQPP